MEEDGIHDVEFCIMALHGAEGKGNSSKAIDEFCKAADTPSRDLTKGELMHCWRVVLQLATASDSRRYMDRFDRVCILDIVYIHTPSSPLPSLRFDAILSVVDNFICRTLFINIPVDLLYRLSKHLR
jgi:hypothetical protein